MSGQIKFEKCPPALNRLSCSGITRVELVSISAILIVIFAFALNLACLIYAGDFCDEVCKDCARAAGGASRPDDAVNAMNSQAKARKLDGYILERIYPELLVYEDYNNSSTGPTPQYGTTEEYNRNNGPNDFMPKTTTTNNGTSTGPGLPPAATGSPGPYVVVRTTLIARIPLYFVFYGLRFSGNVCDSPQHIQFQSIYTYHIRITYKPLTVPIGNRRGNTHDLSVRGKSN